MLTLNTQLETKATTQFTNYDFNSMVKFGRAYLGASSSGLFTLEGELDDTEHILAYFAPITTDFGISRPKRIRSLFIGCEATGPFEVELSTDDGSGETFAVFVRGVGQQGTKVQIGREATGRYWKILFRNKDGCDFSVDSLEVLPVIQTRRKAPAEPFVSLSGSFPSFTCDLHAP